MTNPSLSSKECDTTSGVTASPFASKLDCHWDVSLKVYVHATFSTKLRSEMSKCRRLRNQSLYHMLPVPVALWSFKPKIKELHTKFLKEFYFEFLWNNNLVPCTINQNKCGSWDDHQICTCLPVAHIWAVSNCWLSFFRGKKYIAFRGPSLVECLLKWSTNQPFWQEFSHPSPRL